MNQKTKSGRPVNKVKKEITKEKEPKAKPKAKPKHDTDKIENQEPDFWQTQNLTVLRDQLNKRGFRKAKIDGVRLKRKDYLAQILKMIADGTF